MAVLGTGAVFLAGWRSEPATFGAAVSTPVTVSFDDAHVAHVVAATHKDAALGIGFVHARERGTQLELARRVVHGRLSEAIGATGLSSDQLVRRLRLQEVAQRQLALLPERDREVLEAYARGVNAGWRSTPPPAASRVALQGLERADWTAADSVAWSLFLAFQLSGNLQSELDRMQLSARLDFSDVLLLLPGTTVAGGPPDAGPARVPTSAWPGLADLQPRDATGSNSWAVDATRSHSGSPLLANDPHLPLTMPSPWFFARIRVDGADPAERQDVIGATSPGLPMVVIGRNQHVAWGITRNGADTQDLYLEEVNPSDESLYRAPDGWAPFVRRTEEIRVRGAASVPVVIDSSRNGPVIADVAPSHAEAPVEVRRRIALRWTALEANAGSISAALKANRARNCAELMEAFRSHVAPVQNLLAADDTGRLCFRVVGRVPKRAGTHAGGGLLPAPGWNDAAQWRGWIPYDDMPRLDDAAVDGRSVLANANQPLRMPGAQGLSGEWDLSHREARIEALLAEKARHDARSFQAMQYDTRSGSAALLLPWLLKARAEGTSSQAALAELAAFDGDMRADSAAALAFTAYAEELTRTLLVPRLGQAQFSALHGRRLFRPALERILADPAARARWCSSPDCVGELTESLARAADKLTRTHGSDPRGWRWSRAHGLQDRDVRVELAGDPWTVQMTHYEPAGQAAMYPTRIAANTRLVYDLSDRNASWFVQFGGPDEVPASERNRRALLEWQEGRYRELRFDPRRWLAGFALVPQHGHHP
jgi:penicillin amidase